MHQAIMLFTENRGAHIIRRNLCRNFLLHLVNMHDFNLVNTATIDRAMARLQQIQEELPDTEEEQDQILVSAAACNGSTITSTGGKQGKRTKSALTEWQMDWRLTLDFSLKNISDPSVLRYTREVGRCRIWPEADRCTR